MGQCEKHGELMQVIGEQVEANRQQTSQIDKIFKLVGEIKTAVDQNTVRAEARDKKLATIEGDINNGLRAEVKDSAKKMEQLIVCMDRRKKEHDRGVEGFFRKGFRKIYENGGVIVIVTLGYLVLWTLDKTKIFGEGPAGLLRLLGLG